MDPFSITAGIAGLLSLAIQVQQIVSKYTASVKHAAIESQELHTELRALVTVLEQLERFIERQCHRGGKFEDSSILYGATSSCLARLDTLKLTLDDFMVSTHSRKKRWQRSIQWPLGKEHHRQTLSVIHECMSVFHVSLSIDGWQLVSAASEDLTSVKASQLSQTKDISRILAALQVANEALRTNDTKLGAVEQEFMSITRRGILGWVYTSVDPSISFNSAIKKREPETGLWFLESAQFIQWTRSVKPFWLTGIPGCGKTVLFSTCVEAVQDICSQSPGRRLAYFYFDFQNAETHKVETMLRSLVRQLSAMNVDIPETVHALYTQLSDKGHSPTYQELCTVFFSMAQASDEECYIMLDALDEVPEVSRCEILKFIQNATTMNFENLHILVTSRDEVDIRTAMSHIPHVAVQLAEKDVDADIRAYVRSCLAEPTERLSGLSDALKTEIEAKVGNEAHGMFRWAFCQIDILKQCSKARYIREALEQLPRTLDATYARILSQIHERDYQDAFSILRWLAFSKRPVTLAELAEAAVTRPTEEPFDTDDRLIHVTEVLRICHGLVSLSSEIGIIPRKRTRFSPSALTGTISNRREGAQIVRFSHFSVQEYLLSDRSGQFSIARTAAHAYIGGSCISYLLHVDNAEPLFSYASRYWYEHIQLVDSMSEELSDLVYTMFQPESFARRAYRWLHEYEPATQLSGIYDDFPGPLFYSALFGFLETTERLLRSGVEVNEMHRCDIVHSTDHLEIIRAHPGSLKAKDCTALEVAAFKGHAGIVELLLAHGANCNAKSDHGSILQRTLSLDNLHGTTTDTTQIAMMLLEHGADIRASSCNKWPAPLVGAAAAGYYQIVQLLVRWGTHVDVYAEALQLAIDNGKEAVVQLLLGKRTSPIEPEVLQTAAMGGNHVLTEPIHGQPRKSIGNSQLRGLRQKGLGLMMLNAARKGDFSSINTLVEKYSAGATTNFRGAADHALEVATRNSLELLQLLLSPRAVNLVSQKALNGLLHEALMEIRPDILNLVLLAGADPESVSLGEYAEVGEYTDHSLNVIFTDLNDEASEALKILLRAGARHESYIHEFSNNPLEEGNIGEQIGINALQMVSKRGKVGLVRCLLEHGVDADSHTEGTTTPLILALEEGHEHVVEALLTAGASVHARPYWPDNWSTSLKKWFGPLQRTHFTAVHHARTEFMLDLVVRFKADVNEGEPPPLEHAIQHHLDEKIKYLLDRGAIIRPQLLHSVINRCSSLEFEERLANASTDLLAGSDPNRPAFELAWRRQNKGLMKLLANARAEVRIRGEQGRMHPESAWRHANKALVELLANAGADVHARDGQGRTTLELAWRRANQELVTWLLGKGVQGKLEKNTWGVARITPGDGGTLRPPQAQTPRGKRVRRNSF